MEVENRMSELVTVIIPVYNTVAVYLEECVQSVMQQTFRDFYIILVNDCSFYPYHLGNTPFYLCMPAKKNQNNTYPINSTKYGGFQVAKVCLHMGQSNKEYNRVEIRDLLGLKRTDSYYQSGMMIINIPKWRSMGCTEKIHKMPYSESISLVHMLQHNLVMLFYLFH